MLSTLVLTIQPVSAASATGDRYSQLMEQGKQAEAAGKSDEAIARYQEALRIKPGSALVQTRLAEVYFNRKDFEKAFEYWDRVLGKPS